MKRLLIVYAAAALASSAAAYTYTCEEGHFQIDVPEGWSLTDDPILILLDDNVEYVANEWNAQELELGKEPDRTITIDSFKDNRVKQRMETEYQERSSSGATYTPRYLTREELNRMNVDAGWVTEESLDGYLVKGTRAFTFSFHGYWGPNSDKDDAIRVFNSFRALD